MAVGRVGGHFHAHTGGAGQLIVGVRCGVAEVQEEGAETGFPRGPIDANGIERGAGDEVGGIHGTFADVRVDLHVTVPAVYTTHAGRVAPDKLRVMIVRMGLINKPHPLVETFFKRSALGAFAAEVPFAEGDSLVFAGAAEVHGNDVISAAQGHAAAASNVGVAAVQASHERGA